MNDEFVPRPYWKPEPMLHGFLFWALLLPACAYMIGVVLFGGEAFSAGDIGGVTQGYGSWMMIIGGEIGTLASAVEVFKKMRDEQANGKDKFALVVSFLATLGTILVVYTKMTTLTAVWVPVVQNWGPLALMLFSPVDFYANVMEFAFYLSHFGDDWDKWNLERHNDERKQYNQWLELRGMIAKPLRNDDEIATEPDQLAPPRRIGIAEWREIAASLNGDRANLDANRVNEILVSRGLAQVPGSTARYWADDAIRNGNGWEVAQ